MNHPRVFVSHANADKDYVDGFVNNVLIRGAGLTTSDIFYSSAPDTGIRSGQNLMEIVRNEAGNSQLVIALVTPIYQTRPVCVAELGAAWARQVLLPLMAPGMKRSELEGVLPGLLIESADEERALNDLADRIRDLGFDFNTRSWGVGREQWEAFLRNNPNVVVKPPLPTVDQVKQLQQKLDTARAALDESEKEREELQGRIERLKQAKSASEIREADLPLDERERFEALMDAARKVVFRMPKSVAEALWHKTSERPYPMPDRSEDYIGNDGAHEQVNIGRLEYDEDTGEVHLDESYPDVSAAWGAVEALTDFLDVEERTEEFQLWFKNEFNAPMNLKKKGCWDAVVKL